MHRPASSPPCFTHPFIVGVIGSLLIVIGLAHAHVGTAAPRTGGSTSAGVGHVQISVAPNSIADATSLAERYGRGLTTAWEQFSALYVSEPSNRFLLTFEVQPNPLVTASMRWISDFAWASPDGASAIITLEPFLKLSPIEADNILRNALSRDFLRSASGGMIPVGLADGYARYVETPVLARQARIGSLVQGIYQAGTLPTWDAIIDGGSASLDLDAETLTASRYGLLAFLAQRYGVTGLQSIVLGFARQADWSVVIPSVTHQSIEEMNAAWTQFLPRWFASGWRENAVSGFDLTRAQSLFDRGAYAAAAAEAGRSQQLFTDLNDQSNLRRVEGLLAQSAVGLQADQVMTDAEAALRGHDYPRVLTLLETVDSLYTSLPESHRPAQVLESYQSLAERGITARQELAAAESGAGNWLHVKEARSDALQAGETFSYLGDADGLAQANTLVTDLDGRLKRLIFSLSALTVAISAWLVAWLWYRAPGQLNWRRAALPGRHARPSTG